VGIGTARESASPRLMRLAWDFGPRGGSTHQELIDGGNTPPVSAVGLVSGRAVATAARAQTHNCCRVIVWRLCPIPDKAPAGIRYPDTA